MPSRLSRGQVRVLELLADLEPRWTLSGGGALAGFHLEHRATRDLDLFWHGADRVVDSADDARRRLVAAGLGVNVLQTSPGFVRLRVDADDEVVVLDLVAEPVPAVEPPEERAIGSTQVLVDTRHEILVNKLCALLGRAELRDLADVVALLRAGGDLERALADAPKKDGGFSPLTLAWLLRDMPVVELARGEGRADGPARSADRDDLLARIVAVARPPQE